MCLVYSRFFFIAAVSRSVALCFGQWIGWSNMDRQSEFVCLLVWSNLLSFIFSSGMAFVVCFLFLLFLLFLFLCPLKIRRLFKCRFFTILLGLYWVFFFFIFFIFSGSLVICFVLRMRKLQVSSHRSRLFRQCCFMVITPSHLLCPIENDTWASARKKQKTNCLCILVACSAVFSSLYASPVCFDEHESLIILIETTDKDYDTANSLLVFVSKIAFAWALLLLLLFLFFCLFRRKSIEESTLVDIDIEKVLKKKNFSFQTLK